MDVKYWKYTSLLLLFAFTFLLSFVVFSDFGKQKGVDWLENKKDAREALIKGAGEEDSRGFLGNKDVGDSGAEAGEAVARESKDGGLEENNNDNDRAKEKETESIEKDINDKKVSAGYIDSAEFIQNKTGASVAQVLIPVEATEIEKESPQVSSDNNAETSNIKYYTSSHSRAKYYYPENCSGWKSLSPKYLKGFSSLDDLLASYKREASPKC